jgi:hypothetical protein
MAAGLFSSYCAPQVSIGSNSGVPGASVSLPSSLSSDTNIVAVQYDIIFNPATLSSTGADTGGAQPNHVVATALLNQATRRVVLYSPSNVSLTNGLLANLVFSIATNAPPGVSSVLITNAIFANAQAAQIQPAGLTSGFVLTLAAPARFGSILLSTNGLVQFQVFGSFNQAYVIQASTNLLQWTDVSTNTSVVGEIDFTDNTTSRFRYKFYRVRLGQ